MPNPATKKSSNPFRAFWGWLKSLPKRFIAWLRGIPKKVEAKIEDTSQKVRQQIFDDFEANKPSPASSLLFITYDVPPERQEDDVMRCATSVVVDHTSTIDEVVKKYRENEKHNTEVQGFHYPRYSPPSPGETIVLSFLGKDFTGQQTVNEILALAKQSNHSGHLELKYNICPAANIVPMVQQESDATLARLTEEVQKPEFEIGLFVKLQNYLANVTPNHPLHSQLKANLVAARRLNSKVLEDRYIVLSNQALEAFKHCKAQGNDGAFWARFNLERLVELIHDAKAAEMSLPTVKTLVENYIATEPPKMKSETSKPTPPVRL